jgi:pimeloyl-ACP methyl ester carboxylesterase
VQVVLPGGHHLHMEQPAAVAAAIGDFLAGDA